MDIKLVNKKDIINCNWNNLDEDSTHFDGLDKCVIGMTKNIKNKYILVYSYTKLIEHFIKSQQMTPDDAIDWFNYNIIKTIPYMGVGKPLIVDEYMENKNYYEIIE